MPNWNDVLDEIQNCPRNDALDYVRRAYISKLHEKTGRNVIAYYSGFLQKPGLQKTAINDDDKNGFMATIHNLDRNLGLDLILHTEGGDVAAAESIVHYLRNMFGTDIRAIVPQLSMSAGTMIACSCKEIVLGKHSNLGPIDPHFNGISAHGVIEEFRRASREIISDPRTIPVWQAIIAKYHPTFIGDCEQAIIWSSRFVKDALATGMFLGEPDANQKADEIVQRLSDHVANMSHSRHIHFDECESMGLKIIPLEDDQELQDLVLTIHHAYMHTFSNSPACKIVENQIEHAIINFWAPQ